MQIFLVLLSGSTRTVSPDPSAVSVLSKRLLCSLALFYGDLPEVAVGCCSQPLPGKGKFHFISFAFPEKSFPSSLCNEQHIIAEDI